MPYTAIYTITKISPNKYCVTYWFTFMYGTAISPSNAILVNLNNTKTSVVQVIDPFENLLVNDTKLINMCDSNFTYDDKKRAINSKYAIQQSLNMSNTPKSFIIDTTGAIKITHSISSTLITADKLPILNGSFIIVEVTDYVKPKPACAIL